MQYELEVLDDLISDTINPKKILLAKSNRQQIEEWIILVETEQERIRKKIRKGMGAFMNDNKKSACIYQYQAAITRLMDTVIDYLMPLSVTDVSLHGKETALEKLYKIIYHSLDGLLSYLKDHYPLHFDLNVKIPDVHKLKTGSEIEQNLKFIKKYLRKIKAIESFAELVCEPFEYFLIPNNEFNYRELHYLQEIQKNILEVIKSTDKDIIECIVEKLFFLNFNSVLFYNYYILQLKEEASERKSISDLVEYYSWQIKILNQRLVKANVVYLPHLEPIREQLVFWIAEDLHFLNKKHQLSLALPVSRETAKDKIKKVHVKITVPDLALGAKLLLDDVIINSNYSELIDRIAKNFRTNRRESLSNNNTYNEGYNISVVTREKMKSLLLRLSRKINEI